MQLLLMDYKNLFALLGITLGVIGYIPYLLDIYRGKTKPHAFTWLVWAVLGGITFAIQITEGGGLGAWLTFTTAVISFFVFWWALFRGVRVFVGFDWIALVASFISLGIWFFTGDPTLSVILIIVTEIFGMLPLLRHAYLKPDEETPSMFVIYCFAWAFSLVALKTFSVDTALYASYSVIMNMVIAGIILARRRVNA
jgi:hypothetical protein